MTSLKNIWLAPGTVVYTWDMENKKIDVSIRDYNQTYFVEQTFDTVDDLLKIKKGCNRWINVLGINKTTVLQDIGETLKLHPLVIEDIANTQQRPKFDDMDDYLFVVLKMFCYDKHKHQLGIEHISLILGKNYVVSFQEKGYDFEPVFNRLEHAKSKLRKSKSDYLFYSLIDAVVDNYFVVLEQIEDEVEKLQDQILVANTPNVLPRIQKMKHNLMLLRKSIWPVRELLNVLEMSDSDLVKDSTKIYIKDAYDHTIQAIDTLETLRDIVSGSLDIYLSSTSNRMNEIMKVLTIISTIFIPLTFIVWVYGMNFKYMPEFNEKWTYPVLWVIMLSIGLGMFAYFRKKKWIK